MASLQVKPLASVRLHKVHRQALRMASEGGCVCNRPSALARLGSCSRRGESARDMVRDEFSDPENRLSCTVKNVGTGSVKATQSTLHTSPPKETGAVSDSL
jgi:hypothetical protein